MVYYVIRFENRYYMRRIILSVKTVCFITLLVSFPFLINGKTKPVVKAELILPAKKAGYFSLAAAEATMLNDSLHLDTKGLSIKALEYGIKGFIYLQQKGLLLNKNILSICDFSQSSKNKRLYVIDIEKKKLVLNTFVAHGKNSGSEYANSFSNNPNSLKSSLGFYITGDTYIGGHGLSLKIRGLEKGFNDKANGRNIVVHGSDYVGDHFVTSNTFCGRSYGCPAVPSEESPLVINTIKNGSCLFIYHPTQKYLKQSRILNS